ncbi:MAG TPA: hypothetical protein P5250_06780, partial [Bacteroidales bacterium]|nr:hypothetical protein [Bacteroidales bacterium]
MVYNIKYYCSTPVQLKKILLIIVFYSPLFLNAQFYNGSQLLFGKNRVQYEDKLWTYFRYPKYNVYYTLNGKNLAIYTARYAAEQIPVIEKKLDYTLEENIQFIVFNNLSDLKQSNIGFLSQEQYNTGGITHIVGNKVFLYYNGSHVDFERQIRAGIAYVILEQILYGKSITSMIKNTTLLALPEWYTQGLISYLSDEFNEEVEKHVIDGILSKRYEKFNNLNGIDAIYAGHSIWQYISIKYGENMIPNILYMTKMSRNVESGFLFVLGMSFKSLIREWINYYDKLTYEDNLNRQLPENKPITTKTKKQQAYLNLKISPDGKYAAWVSNNLGKYKIWLYDINKNKAHYIIKYGNKLDDKIDLSFPIIAWHPSGKLLSIIIERKSKFLLYYYELKTKTFTKIRLFDFQKILDFSYSDDGQLMVFSAVQNGQTDLFIFNPASMTYEQITKDLWDDLNPKFIPKTNEIIFSSNRTNDTIVFENENYIVKTENLPKFNNNDIFIYNYKTKSNILKRITNTPDANEIYPSHYKGKYYTYLSNENGIYNRCISYLDSTIAFIDTTIHYKYFSKNYTITDYKRNITEQETNSKIEKTAYIIYKDGK